MSTFACLFPGQGSQETGMGKPFFDAFAAAREVYEEVDDALGQRLSTIIFGDDADTLTRTENAQPAIMATSIAGLRVLEQEAGFVLPQRCTYVAGHSLGEYTALCAAGALTLADTARLLRKRGQAMQQAAPEGSGTMAAILGMELEVLETLLAEHRASGICEIANDNAPGQVVISGERAAVEAVMAAAKDAGAKRAVELNVSAPFHCSLIRDAAEVMREALDAVAMHTPSVPLVANVIAEATQDPDTIKALLVEQVTGRVRWRESVTWMGTQGITDMLEIGHGNVLSGLNRRINRELTSHTIATPDDIDGFLKAA